MPDGFDIKLPFLSEPFHIYFYGILITLGVVAAACGGDDGPDPVTLTVFTDVAVRAPVEELVATFECERPHLNTGWQWFTD